MTKYGLIYASTQKNAGIAGLTIVIIHHRLLRESAGEIPAVFDYRRQAAAAGRVNTPPVFAIYFTGLMCRWLRDRGGVTAAARAGEYKSSLLYSVIDARPLYDCPVVPAARSRVNVCFHLTDPALQGEFLARAEDCGLHFLAGHSDTGGLRASLYNAMPEAGVQTLAAFMNGFADRQQ
ncbi:MAG: aminotransferase class V-fold PLP-dependent enzyme [Gammaproteobacteria bacterium]|nr:aminotransferase class V-fold PLP-dependent enzyme [Gammaproteobacteria bacterium]